MMFRLLLGVVGAAALSTASLAADLPSRRAPPVYVPPAVPAFTWTGFYIGANAGYAFDNKSGYGLAANDPAAQAGFNGTSVSPFASTKSNGFTGGGQIGYNYALGNSFGGLGGGAFVVGVEADAAYTDLKGTTDFIGTGAVDTTYRSRTDYVGTVRGRLGYAFDRTLVYGTGGFAYGGVTNSVNIAAPAYFGTRNAIRPGYAYGGGIEYALPTASFLNVFGSSAVTIKAEFIHYDLGTRTFLASTPAGGSSFTTRVRTDGNLVRAGLNYKFGDVVMPPVVARY